jgi:comEA protein
MWKRELFFFFERLEIRAGERRAIATLLLLGTLLNIAADWMPSPSTYDAAYYEPLMAAFNERVARNQAEAASQDSLYLGLVKAELRIVHHSALGDTSRLAHRAVNVTPRTSSPIPINTATLEQLDSLPGIGPALAARIIQFREENGPFKSIDDLLNVRGIGPALLAKIRDHIVCC